MRERKYRWRTIRKHDVMHEGFEVEIVFGKAAYMALVAVPQPALGQALAELPPPLRTALVLRDVEGLSTQEAAEIAGVGQAAFKSRLHQARLRVRAAIGDQALVAAGG